MKAPAFWTPTRPALDLGGPDSDPLWLVLPGDRAVAEGDRRGSGSRNKRQGLLFRFRPRAR